MGADATGLGVEWDARLSEWSARFGDRRAGEMLGLYAELHCCVFGRLAAGQRPGDVLAGMEAARGRVLSEREMGEPAHCRSRIVTDAIIEDFGLREG